MNDQIDANVEQDASKNRRGPLGGLFQEWVLHLVLVGAVFATLVEGAVSLNYGTIV